MFNENFAECTGFFSKVKYSYSHLTVPTLEKKNQGIQKNDVGLNLVFEPAATDMHTHIFVERYRADMNGIIIHLIWGHKRQTA